MRTTFEATILFRRRLAGCHGAPLLALLLVCWLLSAAGASAEPAAALTADTPPAGQRGVDQKGGATWATLEPGLELG